MCLAFFSRNHNPWVPLRVSKATSMEMSTTTAPGHLHYSCWSSQTETELKKGMWHDEVGILLKKLKRQYGP